jgi:hypothetical protein
MKKITLLAIIGFSFSLASCKKDYTCTCTYQGTSYTYEMKDVKKKDAKTTCNSLGTQWISAGGSCDFK